MKKYKYISESAEVSQEAWDGLKPKFEFQITQELITKLNLIDSQKTVGTSFVNNIPIYEFVEFPGLYIMACNFPSGSISLEHLYTICNGKQTMKISPEFLQDVDATTLQDVIQNHFKAQ